MQGDAALIQSLTTAVALVKCSFSYGVLLCSLCPVPTSRIVMLFVTSACSCGPKEVKGSAFMDLSIHCTKFCSFACLNCNCSLVHKFSADKRIKMAQRAASHM